MYAKSLTRNARSQLLSASIISNPSSKPSDWKNPTLNGKKNRSMELRTTSDHNKSVNSAPSKTSEAKSIKEFSAWAEYMDEEKDEDFIRWKKEMVGECQEQRSMGSNAQKRDTKKENRPY